MIDEKPLINNTAGSFTLIHQDDNGKAFLELRDITKTYPGVVALDHVSMDVCRGEVHVLLGENGAGKSTLIKILSGAISKDSGQILLRGNDVHISSPTEARQLGIATIYQELTLVPELTVADNIFLGSVPSNKRTRTVDRRMMAAAAKDLMAKLGITIAPTTIVKNLPMAQKQLTEIARALATEAEVLVMDEPTSSLSEQEIDHLHEIVRSLKERGIAIIYISHRLEEVAKIGDRVTVLRDGKYIDTLPVGRTSVDTLISLLVGRDLKGHLFPTRASKPGDEILRVEGLRRKHAFHDVSFVVRKGEIVGVAGLVGAGRTEVARAIFGADPLDEGAIFIAGKQVRIKSPEDAIRNGIGLLTEDRKGQGLVLGMSVADNILLPSVSLISRVGVVSKARKKEMAEQYARQLAIKTPSVDRQVLMLSGGNQQKTVLAKWLCMESKVLIFDEPTRGIDVGAKAEVYLLMSELASNGTGIIVISSDLPEVLGISDRIMVMCDGRVTGLFDRSEATEHIVLSCALLGGEYGGAT